MNRLDAAMPEDEVTIWFDALAKQDDAAVEAIWNQYFERLVRLARGKLIDRGRRIADEEDIALSAFNSFCEGAAQGRFPRLHDRQDLWKLLVTITARKAAYQIRSAKRQKRGAGNVRGESVFAAPGDREREPGIGNVLGDEPTPELAAAAAEECHRLLAMLPDDSFREIAQLKLQGYTNEEIAESFQCAPRTVERKLNKIRDLWSSEEVD